MAASTKPCTCRQAKAHKRQDGNVGGKLCGRTFGLQPLRSDGLGDRCHCVAGAGGTAVALAGKEKDYTNFTDSNSSISAFLRVSKVL